MLFEKLVSFRLDRQFQELEDVLGRRHHVVRHVFVANNPYYIKTNFGHFGNLFEDDNF